MCVCVCTYIFLNLLSLYSVTCVYVFRADHLVLDNQSLCSALGKTISPALSYPQPSVVLCVGLRLRLCGLASVHLGMSPVVTLFSSW